MGEIGNIIGQAVAAFALYGLTVVCYTLLGAWKNINIWQVRWDWKVWVNGIVKYMLLGGAFITLIVASYAVIAMAPAWGVELANVQAISSKVIFGVMALGIVAMIVKCITALTTVMGVDKEILKTVQEASVKASTDQNLVIEAPGLPTMPADYVKKKLETEQEGGIGAVYYVPTGSFAQFMAAVNGNGYNIDGAYGAQCWDGAALLWQQLGLSLITGNGLAIGCWDLKRDVNKYDKFDLVTDVNSLRPGDVVVMRPNHIGFFVGWSGSAMRILGQNQGGNGNGAPFNVVNIARSAFAGAFRYRGWNQAPAPTPPAAAPAPVAPAPNGEVKVGSKVRPTRAVDYNGTHLASFVTEREYPVTELKGDRAVLGNGLNTAFHTGDLRVVGQLTNDPVTPAPAQPAEPDTGFKVGDSVVPTKLIDWNGTQLKQWDDAYTISELKGKRAVLNARGAVWAAISTDNIRHA